MPSAAGLAAPGPVGLGTCERGGTFKGLFSLFRFIKKHLTFMSSMLFYFKEISSVFYFIFSSPHGK